jgi:hypothetical protein
MFTVVAMLSIYERVRVSVGNENLGGPSRGSKLQQAIEDPFLSLEEFIDGTDSSTGGSVSTRGIHTWAPSFNQTRHQSHPMYVHSLAEGLHRGAAGNPGGIAIVTMVNAAWMDMLEHMIYSALTRGNISSILVVALDEAGLSACLNELSIPMPCLDGSQYVGILVTNRKNC